MKGEKEQEAIMDCDECEEELEGVYDGGEDKYVFKCVPCKKRYEIFPADEDEEEDTVKVIYDLE